ncbi:hypothetical protein RRV45_01155 [Bacillus sp. DTU_2020_1000418_1_SI_GHA_SEK_038]|uniref:hypothetical protein n=1 Tax=Bacillus sp. DTU_2020_1000418_1_SI_GHA_SEK_038 TaxID=3077585 RepID=UPI0028E2585F|nr:hypothetical protein [Bacillus sp. DTU_2020_1000418_1_SI_GHA_SEK_038]WNS75687.1 hypothetical protein RRV45_01155 [Bacillus sp. DTU_2020_1000418_1_SI_GHA_SEK_038]
MLKMEDASRIMKPGFMNVVAIKNQKLNTIETVFIIKDFNYKLEKLMKSHYANVRATVQGNEKANGLIFMTRFSGMKNKIYHSWFDKTLQVNELFYLINQERLQYFLVDEKNKPFDILVIPNEIREIACKYLEGEDLLWSIDEFNQMVQETMNKYKSTNRIWDLITMKA